LPQVLNSTVPPPDLDVAREYGSSSSSDRCGTHPAERRVGCHIVRRARCLRARGTSRLGGWTLEVRTRDKYHMLGPERMQPQAQGRTKLLRALMAAPVGMMIRQNPKSCTCSRSGAPQSNLLTAMWPGSRGIKLIGRVWHQFSRTAGWVSHCPGFMLLCPWHIEAWRLNIEGHDPGVSATSWAL
jgi:hypothetical protein